MKQQDPTIPLTGSLLLLVLVLSGCGDNLARGSGAAAEPAEKVVRSNGSTAAPSSVAGSEQPARDELAERESRLERREQDLARREAEFEARSTAEPPHEKAVEVDRPRRDTVFAAYEPDPAPVPPSLPQPTVPAAEAAPSVLTLSVPPATVLDVAFADHVSSETQQVGDPVRARVTHDVYWRGYVALPAGAELLGTVTSVQHQKKIGGRSHLAIRFDRITLPAGESVGVRASFEASGKKQATKDAATIGGSAAGGAILGRVLGGDKSRGTAIGAVVGAAVGTVVASRNAGDPVEIAAGTPFQLVLEAPLEVTVNRMSGTTSIARR